MSLNRAQLRDVIRHHLGKRTALDDDPTTGKAGDPAAKHPWPPSALINEQLDEAISQINVEAGFAEVSDLSVPVAVGTATPQGIPLRTVGLDQGLSLGQVNEVRRAYWDDGATTRRLTPIARDELDRDGQQFQAWPVGTPTRFALDGYSLYLYPGVSVAGTLVLIVGTGILGFKTDADFIEQLPNDYHPTIPRLAAGLVAATLTEDLEMQNTSKFNLALGLSGTAKIKKWVARRNVEQQRTRGASGWYDFMGRTSGRTPGWR
jgi:hypothetical protein